MGALFYSLLLIVVFSVNTQATTIYHWAVDNTSNEVISFTAQGDVQRLLRGWESPSHFTGLRIDSQRAVIIVVDQQAPDWNLYILTPDEVLPVTYTFDKSQISLSNFSNCVGHPDLSLRSCFAGQRLTDSYVFVDGPIRMLVNLETLETSPLFASDLAYWEKENESGVWRDPIIQYQFSTDGDFITYLASDVDQTGYLLTRRAIGSDEEERLFRLDSPTNEIYGVSGRRKIGEYEFIEDDNMWLFAKSDWSSAILVQEDGHITNVDLPGVVYYDLCSIDELGDEANDCNNFATNSSGVYVVESTCEFNCLILVFPNTSLLDILLSPALYSPLRFISPDRHDRAGRVDENSVFLVGDNRLLAVTAGGGFWLLHMSEAPHYLGYLSLPVYRDDGFLSPDRRWLVVTDIAEAGSPVNRLWSLQNETITLEVPAPWMLNVKYWYEEGLILSFVDNQTILPTYVYHFVDGSVTELSGVNIHPSPPKFSSSNRIVYQSEQNVLIYNVQNDLLELLVENASLIHLANLE